MGRYGIKRHPLVPAFSAEAVHSRIARRLMQIGARLFNVVGTGLQALHEGVMGQVLRGVAAPQLAGPDGEQFFVIGKKAVWTRPGG
ncbi:hypothetical protein G6F23_015578 [Rhizopus arrhizus]|nr:hypothetical protein G6F23_015578 [Rhizopus arrhizus]